MSMSVPPTSSSSTTQPPIQVGSTSESMLSAAQTMTSTLLAPLLFLRPASSVPKPCWLPKLCWLCRKGQAPLYLNLLRSFQVIIPSDEFDHIKTWARANKLILNLGKTKEIVFRRPRALHFYMPLSIDYIEQLDCAKLRGILNWILIYNIFCHSVPSECIC